MTKGAFEDLLKMVKLVGVLLSFLTQFFSHTLEHRFVAVIPHFRSLVLGQLETWEKSANQ